MTRDEAPKWLMCASSTLARMGYGVAAHLAFEAIGYVDARERMSHARHMRRAIRGRARHMPLASIRGILFAAAVLRAVE